jgi:hypothetical protein
LLKRPLLYFFCLLCFAGIAQSRKRNFRQRELGFFGGGSYYIGDINPRGHFLFSSPAAGVYFRYTTNYRYAFRFGFNYGKIYGNDAQSGEPDQEERNLSFKSNIYEFHTLAEFNFVEYRIGHDRYRFTMFIFAGLAGYYFKPLTNIGNGNVSLRGLHTEGQSKTYPEYQISIPFGLGLKWNVGERCGLGIEWGPRRTFTDYLDDIKGTYPANLGTEGSQNTYTDRSTNGSSPGGMRGNPSTRDWYFYYGINLNIKLRDPHQVCHGAGRR